MNELLAANELVMARRRATVPFTFNLPMTTFDEGFDGET